MKKTKVIYLGKCNCCHKDLGKYGSNTIYCKECKKLIKHK